MKPELTIFMAMKPTNPSRRIFTLLPLLALVMSLNQCSCSDTLGSFFVTEQDEARIGAQFDAELQTKSADYPLYRTTTAQRIEFAQYVQNVFDKVLADIPSSQKPDYPFKLTIIDANVENAFAVPGGYVYIYTGIIGSMQSESELAGVLAHEIAHVTQHHYRDAMMKTAGISLVVQALAGNDSSVLKSAVKGLFTQLAELKVSRSNEDEADAYGTRYLGYAGWDPYGIADFFSRMPSTGIEWLSTHPDPATRVQAVKDLVYQEAGGVNGHPAWNVGAKNVLVQNADEFRKQLAKMHN